ncbi:hypothetical protein [Nocardia arthritidis]|uniref:DUF559 domain-containing protein n=1 Tax=Nocardia arthritidis TaxID=228602 RepID=A0A6G9YPE3_9NOCA|nr:hypothetical protein [Nocardia arthritidis]QIS14793.1 hypothetical protein F5544_34800 [Nocardia arthritidis]
MGMGPIDERDISASGAVPQVLPRAGWVRVRSGCWVPPESRVVVDPVARHRILLEASIRRMSAEGAVSHQSAAVLRGLPVWGYSLDRVHVTRRHIREGQRGRYVRVHCAPYRDDETDEIDGMRTLSAQRTVVDLARCGPPHAVVATGDAAAQRFSVTRRELRAALGYAVGRQGYHTALRVLDLIDGRSESVGESRSRMIMADARLPEPELQTIVLDETGRSIGRVDFCFPDFGVIGEFDGGFEYGCTMTPDADPSAVIQREKRREAQLRDLGWQVVRWTWLDLDKPDLLTARLRRALTAGTNPAGAILRAPRPD